MRSIKVYFCSSLLGDSKDDYEVIYDILISNSLNHSVPAEPNTAFNSLTPSFKFFVTSFTFHSRLKLAIHFDKLFDHVSALPELDVKTSGNRCSYTRNFLLLLAHNLGVHKIGLDLH
jgi:hypothetical protein